MNKMDEYLNAVADALNNNPRWRYGQTLFNVLYEMHPEVADEIRGADLDPFYKRDRKDCVDFLHYVNCKIDKCKHNCSNGVEPCICDRSTCKCG